MPDIAVYTDYRKFLGDYYKEAKAKNHGFSYQVLSEHAGFTSKGFLHNVMQGKRSLSRGNILGLSHAMRLNKYEADYFENLVAFNQAKNLRERNHFFERLLSIKARGTKAWKPQLVRNDQFEFYSKLYHSVIRSLIGMHGFTGDYERLAKSVRPRITVSQARKSVELLAKLGFIRKLSKGSYEIADKSIATPAEVMSLAVQNFHEEAGGLALKALSELPKDNRNITGVTLGISSEAYKTICEEIQTFRSRLLQIAEADRNADAVYQLNFQFFPVSGTTIERKRI
ncbi:MAG: TIGR02147 family protein [Chitinispirillaceae bacterium]|jgi:uncharacterized protein (TIGR02147 family)